MQDCTVYSDHSSPTAKTKSVMTCLKLAARHNWDLLKLDVGGAFLCANMDESEEVFMVLVYNFPRCVVNGYRVRAST